MSASETPSALSIKPLGPGDLVDRAVRFYRKFFWTFVLIASPPVLIGTTISVGWSLLGRELFNVGVDRYSAEYTGYLLFTWFGGIIIWLSESIATLVVMGGASRNFVRHLLFGEPITFRETYKNVWSRLGALIVAATMMTIVLGTLGFMLFYFGFLITFLLIILVVSLLTALPAVAFIVSVIIGLAGTFFTAWLFFLLASRIAYVPQVMLVEGQGVFSAIARSAALAGRNVRRLATLFVFTTVAAYSALALFYVPLAWYASAHGVQLMTFDPDTIQAWYEICYSVIWQLSIILLSPVWMIGLCLLYVDERVRGEAYDIELMAARRLGEIPAVQGSSYNPLHPALGPTRAEADSRQKTKLTSLGLS